MTKTYGMNGVVEVSLLFKAGNGHLRANFSGGNLDPLRLRPATLQTHNPVAMLIIEHTPEFKQGKIFIVAQSDDAPSFEPVKPAEVSVAKKATKKTKADRTESDGMKVYEGVSALGEAVNVLLELGAKASYLSDPTSIMQTAADMNVSFPNLKLK